MSRLDTTPPGPGPLESLRRLARFFDDPVAWYDDLRTTYGDLVALRAGPLRMTVAFDPDLVERLLVRDAALVHKGDGLRTTRFVLGNGLITADGDDHQRHRKLAAPVFTPRNIRAFADATVDIALDAISTWPDDAVTPLARDLYDISLRVAGVGLFGCDFDAAEREQLHESMRVLNDGYRTLSMPAGQRVTALQLTPGARRLHAARDHVDEVIRALVTQRRLATDADQLSDLLSRLLAARDEDDGGSFSDEELRDEAVTMLLAGHDTTAATLGWCLAMLATHPDEQAAARAEVDAVLGTGADGRRVTADDLRDLPRLRAVIDETMRLHPAVYSTVRDPVEPIVLDDGVVLEPGTDVVIPIAGIHRDPRLWSAPNEFRPQRFIDGDGVERAHRIAFIPFGTGRRICIGSSFALQELVLVLATVLQHVELAAPDGFALRPHVGFIRRPAGELPLRVTRR